MICKLLKSLLYEKFKLKDLSKLKYFFGLEVVRSPVGISLCQRKYSLKILQEAGLLASKPVTFSMEQNIKLNKNVGDLLPNPTVYRRPGKRLLYLTITRPDLCYYVSRLGQYMTRPRQPHLQAAYKILQYIKGTPGHGLFFPVDNTLSLKAFPDSDWTSCPDSKRSTSVIVFFLRILWFHGRPRNRQLFLNLLLRLSIDQWLLLFVILFGF